MSLLNAVRTFRYGLAMLMVAGLVATACGSDESAAEPVDSSGQIVAQQATSTPILPATVEPATEAPPANQAETQATDEPTSEPDVPVTATDIPVVPSEPAPEPTVEPTPTPEPPPAEPDNPAPALGSIDSWHNSPPVTLAELRGSPVLLVFWADY